MQSSCGVRHWPASLLGVGPNQPSLAVVFVVAAVPVEGGVGGTRLVSSPRCPVQPLVHAPQAVQAARVGRGGVVDDAWKSRLKSMPDADAQGKLQPIRRW